MTGLTKEEILSERQRILSYLDGRFPNGYEVVDQINLNEEMLENYKSPLEILAEDIKLLNMADIVVFPSNFHKSKGCRIEWNVCKVYEKKRLVIEEI